MKVGVFLTTYGDEARMTNVALTSFRDTADAPYRLLVHSTLPGPAMKALREAWEGTAGVAWHEESAPCALPRAFNQAAAMLLADPTVTHLSSIHNDMEFPRPWMAPLLRRLQADPGIGKIHPINLRDGDVDTENGREREGNECPWIMPRAIWEQIGGEDEAFLGGGEMSDWCVNRRVKALGLRVLIVPDAQIMHVAMATRFKYNTTNLAYATHNRAHYRAKYGTDDPAV